VDRQQTLGSQTVLLKMRLNDPYCYLKTHPSTCLSWSVTAERRPFLLDVLHGQGTSSDLPQECLHAYTDEAPLSGALGRSRSDEGAPLVTAYQNYSWECSNLQVCR
jgi:hypothetical protein